LKINYKIIVYFLFTLITIYIFAPYTWLFTAAFSETASFVTKIPDNFTLENFVEVFQGNTLRWIMNTILISLVSVFLCVSVTSIGGYALSRNSFRGKSTMLYAIILTRVLPLTLLAVPIFSIILIANLMNTYTGLILVLVALQIPIGLWIMKGAIDSIPIEVEEAAQIDGATGWTILIQIILPLMKPGLAAVCVISLVGAWSNFLIPFILMSSESKMPISVGIYSSFGMWGTIDYPALATLCIIYMMPPIIFYLVLRPYFFQGLGSIGSINK